MNFEKFHQDKDKDDELSSMVFKNDEEEIASPIVGINNIPHFNPDGSLIEHPVGNRDVDDEINSTKNYYAEELKRLENLKK